MDSPGTDGPIERLHYLFWYVLKVYLICRLLADRAQTTVAVELFSWTHLPNNYWSDRKGVDQGATGKCFDGCMPTFVPYYVNHLHVHGSSIEEAILQDVNDKFLQGFTSPWWAPYFLIFLLKLLFRLNAPSTGDAVVTASRTALTRWRLLSVKRLVTFPGRPALAVRPTLCRNSTADDANSAWAHAHQRQICEIADDATSTTTIWRQHKNKHSLNLMRVTHNVSDHHLHHV